MHVGGAPTSESAGTYLNQSPTLISFYKTNLHHTRSPHPATSSKSYTNWYFKWPFQSKTGFNRWPCAHLVALAAAGDELPSVHRQTHKVALILVAAERAQAAALKLLLRRRRQASP